VSKPGGERWQLLRCFPRRTGRANTPEASDRPASHLGSATSMLSKTCTSSLQDGGPGERQRKTRRWDSWSLFPALTQTSHQVASLTSCFNILATSTGGRVTPWEALVTDLLHPTRALAEGQVLHSHHPHDTFPAGKC